MSWINKDTEIYCSFAKKAGNTGCQMMNSAFYYYGLNKIYNLFSVDSIEDSVNVLKLKHKRVVDYNVVSRHKCWSM